MSKKKFPELKTDAEAERFVATADLSAFDFSDMKPMRFELRRKDKTVSCACRSLCAMWCGKEPSAPACRISASFVWPLSARCWT